MYSRQSLKQAIDWFKVEQLGGINNSLDIDNKSHRLSVIEKKAYVDMMPRTLKGHTPTVKKHMSLWLEHRIAKFLEQPPQSKEDFTASHEEICNGFVNEYNRVWTSGSIAYGKAQKIVNMTFKYLYCFDVPTPKPAWFSFCHMPIDKYTLKWYLSLDKTPNGYRRYAANGNEPSWSNLDIKTYKTIQEDICKYCTSINNQTNNLTPFESEFFIWKEEKIKEWLEAGKKLLGTSFPSFPKYKNDDIHSAASRIQQYVVAVITNKFE